VERRSEGSAVVPNQSVEPRVIPKRTEGLFWISGNGAAQARASGSHGAIALVSGLKQRMTGKRFGDLYEGLVSRDRRVLRQKD
jgi:hypothetical protein